MRIYTQRHLDRLGQRCRAAIGLVKGPGLPSELALSMASRLTEARTLIVDAEMLLGDQRDAARLLAKADTVTRRAYRRLRTAYQDRRVSGARYERLSRELGDLLASLRAMRKGLLGPRRG